MVHPQKHSVIFSRMHYKYLISPQTLYARYTSCKYASENLDSKNKFAPAILNLAAILSPAPRKWSWERCPNNKLTHARMTFVGLIIKKQKNTFFRVKQSDQEQGGIDMSDIVSPSPMASLSSPPLHFSSSTCEPRDSHV